MQPYLHLGYTKVQFNELFFYSNILLGKKLTFWDDFWWQKSKLRKNEPRKAFSTRGFANGIASLTALASPLLPKGEASAKGEVKKVSESSCVSPI